MIINNKDNDNQTIKTMMINNKDNDDQTIKTMIKRR